MRMLAAPGFVSGGEIRITRASRPRYPLRSGEEEDSGQVRLSRIAYIPQGAMNSLNPRDGVSRPRSGTGIVAHEGAIAGLRS